VYQDHAGAIWIGTWPANLSRLKDGRVTNYSTADGLSGEPITALYEDRERRLWVGAYGARNGLRVLQNGRFTFPEALANLGQVKAIHQDREGAMWFGTDEKIFRFRNDQLTSYTKKDGLAGNGVLVIRESRTGDLWFGGPGGITRFRKETLTPYTEQDGVPGGQVRSLYEDADGVLWIGTYDGGLGRLENGVFTRYTMRQGLFDDGAFQILEDDDGNFWMSSNRGIYRVSKRELNDVATGKAAAVTSIGYGKSDGMRSSECNGGNSPAGIKARDGTLWFPTQDGVVKIDPRSLPTNLEPPPVRIEACRVDLTPVRIDSGVTLEPRQNSFEIEYTALSFIKSGRIRFKYKLEGLESEWVDAGTRRTAYYSHVPPGNYTFRVIAANADGIWNSQGDALRFDVLPPFYRTAWFSMLICTVAAGLLYLAWHSRVSQLERVNAMQQAFSRQLIESQESERKRIASELHDSLGQHLLIIKNRASLGERFAPDASRMVEQFSEITESASLAISEVRAIAYNLRPLNLERLGLTAVLEEMIEKVSAASAIQFTADIAPLDGLLAHGADINIYRIVQETINNIVKHSEATKASIELWTDDGWLNITVRDNGRGLGSSAETRTGLGLTSIAERVQMLGGTQTITPTADNGTTVAIRIPVQGAVATDVQPPIAIEQGPIV
jgi:signal transduction histidine kinase